MNHCTKHAFDSCLCVDETDTLRAQLDEAVALTVAARVMLVDVKYALPVVADSAHAWLQDADAFLARVDGANDGKAGA